MVGSAFRSLIVFEVEHVPSDAFKEFLKSHERVVSVRLVDVDCVLVDFLGNDPLDVQRFCRHIKKEFGVVKKDSFVVQETLFER